MKRLLIAMLLSVASFAASAETVTFEFELNGSLEVPPNDSAGTGSATATFDTETRTLSWTVSYEGTTGPLIGGHIHGPAEAGANAGIMVPFGDLASPITGEAQLTEAQAADLMAGLAYINLHTEAHPGGELRGQFVPGQ